MNQTWADIREREIIRSPRGKLRVVRRVSSLKNGDPYVTLVILRRSWTDHCYTLYRTSELIRQGYTRTGRSLSSWDEFDELILQAITERNHGRPHLLSARDVIGVVE